MRKLLAISAATSALLAGSVLPAHAVAWDGSNIVVGDQASGTYTEWELYSDPYVGHAYRYVSGATDFGNVICEGLSFRLDGNETETSDLSSLSDSDWDLVTDSADDKVMTVSAQFTTDSSAVVGAEIERRFYAEGDLVRETYVLTNDTGSAIIFTPSLIDGSSLDNDGEGSTSDGDQTWEVSDWWLTVYDSTSPSVVATWLFGAPDLLSIETIDGNTDIVTSGGYSDFTMSDVTIQPGASLQFVFFYAINVYTQGAGAAASAAAADDAIISEYASGHLAGRLVRGLDETVPGANVHLPDALEETGDDELAETGVAASGIAIGGAMLSAAGIALVATRRRKASN